MPRSLAMLFLTHDWASGGLLEALGRSKINLGGSWASKDSILEALGSPKIRSWRLLCPKTFDLGGSWDPRGPKNAKSLPKGRKGYHKTPSIWRACWAH
eukprot:7775531-Karenia_brevis.AAC.1